MVTVPVFVPRPRKAGSPVTVRVTGDAPSVPLDGVTVSHGLSTLATNGRGVGEPGRVSVCTIVPSTPTSALALLVRGGTTKMPTGSEYGPRESLQLLMPRTR